MYIPDPVVKRLPMYYRYLGKLESEGVCVVSSADLAEMMRLTASQVRQDINVFGGTGRQGRGYPVAAMRQHIGSLLGINRPQTMIIVGAGNLGCALMGYEAFGLRGFQTVGAFDNDPEKAGRPVGKLSVRPLEEIEAFLQEQTVDIAVLALPAAAAQTMAERLYSAGVRGFWNFAPVDLHLPREACIVNVHLDETLELLSYRLAHPNLW